MDRYTRKHAESAFTRLVKILGPAQSGHHWALDYEPVYGGFRVEEVDNQTGGVHLPFGSLRRSAREFCTMVRFLEDAQRVMTRETYHFSQSGDHHPDTVNNCPIC